MTYWSVPRAWPGEPIFVIAGGPSVAQQDLSLLCDRRVIVLNSSYQRVRGFAPPKLPHADNLLSHADYLLFNDERWWREHGKALTIFPAPIITTGFQEPKGPRAPASVHWLRNSRPYKDSPAFKLSEDRSAIPVRRTILAGGINVGWLLNCGAPLVLLGADGGVVTDKQLHHHVEHSWASSLGSWKEQHDLDLVPLAADLKARGVPVLNASPGSRWKLWPVMDLGEAIARVDAMVSHVAA